MFSDKALYNNKTGQNNKKSPFRGLLKLTEGIQQIEMQSINKNTICQLWMVGVSGVLTWGFSHWLHTQEWISAEIEEGSAEPRTPEASRQRSSLGLELEVGNLCPSVVSKVLIRRQDRGDQWLRQTKAVAQLGTNWWTGGLAWNLTGRSEMRWPRGSWKPLHVSTQRLEKPLDPYVLAACETIHLCRRPERVWWWSTQSRPTLRPHGL